MEKDLLALSSHSQHTLFLTR